MPEQQQFTNSRFLRLTECPLRQSTIPHAQFSKSTENTEGHINTIDGFIGWGGGKSHSKMCSEFVSLRVLRPQNPAETKRDGDISGPLPGITREYQGTSSGSTWLGPRPGFILLITRSLLFLLCPSWLRDMYLHHWVVGGFNETYVWRA